MAEHKRILRSPLDQATLQKVLELAQAAGHKEIVELLSVVPAQPGKPLSETEHEERLKGVVACHPAFNGLPSVQGILRKLVKAWPTAAPYRAVTSGNPKGKSTTLLMRKAQTFVTTTTIRRVLDKKQLPSDKMSIETRLRIAQVDEKLTRMRMEAQKFILSPKFVCAGSLATPYSPCLNGCVVMDNTDGQRDLESFTYDHAIGFATLGQVYDTIHADVKENKAQRDTLNEFIKHLAFGTTRHPEHGWPPNVYLRCPACNADGEKAFGRTHQGM